MNPVTGHYFEAAGWHFIAIANCHGIRLLFVKILARQSRPIYGAPSVQACCLTNLSTEAVISNRGIAWNIENRLKYFKS
jgi:hypothetical protein